MDIDHAQEIALEYIERIPGSGIVLRYIRSSYQNDPIRSVIELVLFLFTVRYLLTPSYSTKKPVKDNLTEEVRPRFSAVKAEHVTYTE